MAEQKDTFDQEQALKEYTRLMEVGPLAENEEALRTLIEQAYAQGMYFDYDCSKGSYMLVRPVSRSGECVECGIYSSALSVQGYCEGCVMQAAINEWSQRRGSGGSYERHQ